MYTSKATNQGVCNWNPQPICAPPAFSATMTPANVSMETKIPAVYSQAPRCTSCRDFEDLEAIDSALIDNTGNTQGIKFRISPPAKAINKTRPKDS